MANQEKVAAPLIRIGVDIGGTFTDLIGVCGGRVYVEKILSSVDDYSVSIAAGINEILKRSGANAADVYQVVHGTTVATNAILEGRGAKSGLITTLGFRDVLGSRLIKATRRVRLQGRRMRDSFGLACRIV